MSTTDEYLDAKHAFQQMDDQITAMASLLDVARKGLAQSRNRFFFSNSGVGLPAEVVMVKGNASLNAHDWPSAEKIQQMLSNWHASRQKMDSAWNAVPAARKTGLQTPPALPRGY